MWRLGFFFHEMAFGLLSVFLPLYVIAIGGSLFDIGLMFFAEMLLFINFEKTVLAGGENQFEQDFNV